MKKQRQAEKLNNPPTLPQEVVDPSSHARHGWAVPPVDQSFLSLPEDTAEGEHLHHIPQGWRSLTHFLDRKAVWGQAVQEAQQRRAPPVLPCVSQPPRHSLGPVAGLGQGTVRRSGVPLPKYGREMHLFHLCLPAEMTLRNMEKGHLACMWLCLSKNYTSVLNPETWSLKSYNKRPKKMLLDLNFLPAVFMRETSFPSVL